MKLPVYDSLIENIYNQLIRDIPDQTILDRSQVIRTGIVLVAGKGGFPVLLRIRFIGKFNIDRDRQAIFCSRFISLYGHRNDRILGDDPVHHQVAVPFHQNQIGLGSKIVLQCIRDRP